MNTIKPSKYQLFAKPDEAETTTKSGILLTDNSLDKPKTATVVNVGSKVTEYSPNDVIVYREYATTEIKVNSDDYLLIAEDDVLGTVVEVQA